VTRKLLLILLALPAVVGLVALVSGWRFGLLTVLFEAYALAALVLLAIVAGSRLLRRFLYRVGRRLAFSYLLLGALPLVMVALLSLVVGYVVCGFFAGHLFRDGVAEIEAELEDEARAALELLLQHRLTVSAPRLPIATAYYRDGVKLTGAPEAPARWQSWWPASDLQGARRGFLAAPFVARADGRPTLLAAVTHQRFGVLVYYDGDELARVLSEAAGVWVDLIRDRDEKRRALTTINVKNRAYPIRLPQWHLDRAELAAFFYPGEERPGWFDRPLIDWLEMNQPYRDLASGADVEPGLAIGLTGSLRSIGYFLVSRAAEIATAAYGLLVFLAVLLADVYFLAALMAVLMIVGLSRAVNRLSEATERVKAGDFSTRIDVQRRDQIGDLQRSFNQMIASLESLVAAGAQKEILEKELAIARELQQSLLPDGLGLPPELPFDVACATYFEPSAAIGGDYFDILPLGEERLAVLVADVSGHGLPAGLRMAMLKSALELLIDDGLPPLAILERLDKVVRSSGPRRGFVTATLAVLEPDDAGGAQLVITNAGHPPTYLLRRGAVTEIALPGPPLGALGHDYGHRIVPLEPDDVVVWLSDGLIEAGAGDEVFGYARTADCLGGLDPDPDRVRDHLLDAVRRHAGEQPPDDDRTLVVLRYRPTARTVEQPDAA